MSCIGKSIAERTKGPRLVTAVLLSALPCLSGLQRAEAGINEWTPAGLGGISISTIAIDPRAPGILYAGSAGNGLFKSTDGATTWTAINAGLTDMSISDLAIDPSTTSTLYAGTSGSGVFKSADAGETWSAIGPAMLNPITHSVAIDPVVPTTLYAALRAYVWKSADGGATWTNLGGAGDFVSDVEIDPMVTSTIYICVTRFNPFGGGLYKSLDGGSTFTFMTGSVVNPLGRHYDVATVAIDPSRTSTLYISTEGGGVFKSTDGGATWNTVGPGLSSDHAFALVIDPLTPTTLYAGAGGAGVFKSTDGGASWTAINNGLGGTNLSALAIDPQRPTTLYAGTDSGVLVLEQQDISGNHAPVAEAGPDQIVEATGSEGALVSLDGSGSTDPDGDTLTFAWSWPAGSAEGVRATVSLPLGATTVTLVVSDPQGATATDTVQITVRDTTPPGVALTSPADGATVSGTINVTASASDAVSVAGVQFLLNGEPVGPEDTSAPYEVPWDTRTVPDGAYELEARARDSSGNTATSDGVTITVANGPVPTVTLARSEESAATLAPEGAWSVITNEDVGVGLSGSRAVYAGAAGSTASFTFTGNGVRWIGFPCERCGVAEVLIDGTRVATVDTFSAGRPASSTAMYTSAPLPLGSHTLMIEVTGTANTASEGPFVVVDAIDALLDGAGALSPVAPVSSSLFSALP